MIHGRNNYGQEVQLYEYDTLSFKLGRNLGPVRVSRRRINKRKRLPISKRDKSSFQFERDQFERCKWVKLLKLTAAPSTSFYKAIIYDFTDRNYEVVGARVYKLCRKGEDG